ncbi:hypothetical protein ACWD48_19770 [Streptomyces sp. NPDC002519]
MSADQIPDDDDIQIADIKAVRCEGPRELRALMRAQIAIGRSRRDDKPKPAVPAPPGHSPGVWPTGTSPPGPPPDWQIPARAWRAAARHYSNEEHRPDLPCDCGNCPPPEAKENQ